MNLTRLGFLVSGRGSNMEAIINACVSGALKAKPAVVISNNAEAGALHIAKNRKIPAYHLSSKTHPDPDQLDKAITEIMKNHQVDLVYWKMISPRYFILYFFRMNRK